MIHRFKPDLQIGFIGSTDFNICAYHRSSQIWENSLVDTDMILLKFMWKVKIIRLENMILKNEEDSLTLLCFTKHCDASSVDQQGKIQSSETGPHKYTINWHMTRHWIKIFSTSGDAIKIGKVRNHTKTKILDNVAFTKLTQNSLNLK